MKEQQDSVHLTEDLRGMSTTLAGRIAELIEQHGSLRAAARVLECDAGYLSRLQSGEKDNPEDWLLRRMKLRRVVSYERTDAPAAGGVDWLGLALDLEAQAKRVESQTVERAMLAAAHGLRLMGNAGSDTPS